VNLVGFIIRIYHYAQSSERQIYNFISLINVTILYSHSKKNRYEDSGWKRQIRCGVLLLDSTLQNKKSEAH